MRFGINCTDAWRQSNLQVPHIYGNICSTVKVNSLKNIWFPFWKESQECIQQKRENATCWTANTSRPLSPNLSYKIWSADPCFRICSLEKKCLWFVTKNVSSSEDDLKNLQIRCKKNQKSYITNMFPVSAGCAVIVPVTIVYILPFVCLVYPTKCLSTLIVCGRQQSLCHLSSSSISQIRCYFII